jgi:hypothetical protein
MTAPVIDVTARASSTAPPAMTLPGTTPPARRTRPRTQYWDVFEACWRTCPPALPAPRSGD